VSLGVRGERRLNTTALEPTQPPTK